MYTADAFKIAQYAIRSPEYRAELLELLSRYTAPIVYTGQDFDRAQHLAATLSAPLLRTPSASTVVSLTPEG